MNDVGNLHERDGTDTSDVKQLRQVIDQSVENAETKNVYVMVEIVVSFQGITVKCDSSANTCFTVACDTAANTADIAVCPSCGAVHCHVSNCTASTTHYWQKHPNQHCTETQEN